MHVGEILQDIYSVEFAASLQCKILNLRKLLVTLSDMLDIMTLMKITVKM